VARAGSVAKLNLLKTGSAKFMLVGRASTAVLHVCFSLNPLEGPLMAVEVPLHPSIIASTDCSSLRCCGR
jgi:hypothetical protein